MTTTTQPTRTERNRWNDRLADLSMNRRYTVQGFIDEAALIDERIAEALQGVWTGDSGQMTEDVPGTRLTLHVRWYEKRVEVAYVS